MNELEIIQGTINTKSAELHNILTAAKQTDGSMKMTDTEREDIQNRNKELTELGVKRDNIASVKAIEVENQKRIEDAKKSTGLNPGNPEVNPNAGSTKSLGELFIESPQYKSTRSQNIPNDKPLIFQLDNYDYRKAAQAQKAAGFTITGTQGVPVFPQLTDIYIGTALQIPLLMNYLPIFTMTSNSYEYRRETVYNNNAASAAENTTLAKSGFSAITVTSTAQAIGHYLEVTEQQLADAPNMLSIINDRAKMMLDIELELQLLSGSGTGSDLTGFYNQGFTNYAKGTNVDSNGEAENNADAIYRAIVGVQTVGFANPDLVILNPLNQMAIRLMKDANGNYIWGNPAETGNMRLWSLPVLSTMNATSGTALVGAFGMYSRVGMRQGATVKIQPVGSDALNLLQTLTIYLRAGLEIYRSAAFRTVSALV